jgi:ADP-ribosyl-[dinitrogen reductase] hydrolase
MNASIVPDRLRGVAVGAALGDAFGMPLEFKPIIELPRLVRTFKPGRLPAGTFTDDTEMALALAESLEARHPLDAGDLVRRFLDWYHREPVDIGNQTRTVLANIDRLKDWQKAVAESLRFRPDSAGNASVMRCWPVAIAWWNFPSQLAADSALQSRVTHPHAECVSGSVFVNVWIAGLVQGKTALQAFEQALSGVEMPEEMRTAVKLAPTMRREALNNSGWVRHTLQTAAWAVLTTSSFTEAVIQAANLGNDADTGAAVTGAVAGAVYGLSSIPPDWRNQLRGEWPIRSRKTWMEQDFIALADRLAQINT